jgi:4-amino-4-deoxy-L-arabinose transferase-like glycosyltransferase
MKKNCLTFSKDVYLLIILGTIIYIFNLTWAPALLDDADSVHAEAAREMMQRGNYSTLYINGLRYLEKAPLMYWLIGWGFRVFGAMEWVARLPLGVATVVLMLLVRRFTQWAAGDRAGLYAGLITGTSIGIFLFTRILIPDVIVAVWLTATLYCFLRAVTALEQARSATAWLMGMYSFAALTVLTKGLIGIVFPGGTVFFFLLITGKWRLLRQVQLFSGTLLFFFLAAPWHIIAGLQNENPQGHGFFWFYFINEHFLRYLGKRYPVDYDKVPLLLFYLLHLVWLFPWSIFAILYRPANNEAAHTRQTLLVSVIWPSLIILFFSFSTRQEYYTFPAWPALAILLGYTLARAEAAPANASASRWLGYLRASLFTVSILITLGVAILLWRTRHFTPTTDIATLLTRHPEYYALSLGHIFDLTPESLSTLRLPLVGATIAFLLGSGSSWWYGRQHRHFAANLALALMMLMFFVCSQQALHVFEPYLSSKALAQEILRRKQPDALIILNGEYESGSSINFYTQRPLLILNNRTANLEFGSYYPDAPQRFLNDQEFLQYWEQVPVLYVVTTKENLATLQALLGNRVYYPLAESGGKLLLSNQP